MAASAPPRPRKLPLTPSDLVAWREGHGWTQVQAAAWYGVSDRQWRRYETGVSAIRPPLARAVASRPVRR